MFVFRKEVTPRHLAIFISVSMHRPPPQKETQSKTCRACNAGQYNGRLFKDERKSTEDILKKYLAVTPWNGAHCLAHAVGILKLCDCVPFEVALIILTLWWKAHLEFFPPFFYICFYCLPREPLRQRRNDKNKGDTIIVQSLNSVGKNPSSTDSELK